MRTRWKTAALAGPFVAGWLALFIAGGAAERVFARLFVGKNYDDLTERGIFVVHPKGQGDQARKEAQKLDAFMDRLQKQYPTWKLRRPEDLKVYLMTSTGDFNHFGTMETGSTFENNGGYFSSVKHQIVTLWGVNMELSLRHEGTHAMFHERELPRWLSEGLATYFENSSAQRLGGADPGSKRHAREVLKDPRFSLKRILEAGPGDFKGEDNDLFYDMSNVMVAFFMEGPDEIMRQFIKDVGGDSPGELPSGMSLEDFKKRLIDYLGD